MQGHRPADPEGRQDLQPDAQAQGRFVPRDLLKLLRARTLDLRLMQNLSAAHRQISASTIERYRAMATPIATAPGNSPTLARTSRRCSLPSRAVPPYRILYSGRGPGRGIS